MEDQEIKFFPDNLAKSVSIIFHPLFMPLYGMLIIFSAPTLFGYLPFDVKRLLFLIVLINNVLLPFMLLPFFRHRNIISSWTIEERRERILPLVLTTILYASTSYIIYRFPVPPFLKAFFLSTLILSAVLTVINFWWKVSIHSAGAGALIALVLILSHRMYTPLLPYLIVAVLVAGLVMSSRLKLNSHDYMQVWISLLTGISGMFLLMHLLQ
jgi:hypothetical protein